MPAVLKHSTPKKAVEAGSGPGKLANESHLISIAYPDARRRGSNITFTFLKHDPFRHWYQRTSSLFPTHEEASLPLD